MQLMTLTEYRETCYTPQSRPKKPTLIRLIQQGIIAGKKLGKFYYVDITAESRKTGNPLVDRVLQGG